MLPLHHRAFKAGTGSSRCVTPVAARSPLVPAPQTGGPGIFSPLHAPVSLAWARTGWSKCDLDVDVHTLPAPAGRLPPERLGSDGGVPGRLGDVTGTVPPLFLRVVGRDDAPRYVGRWVPLTALRGVINPPFRRARRSREASGRGLYVPAEGVEPSCPKALAPEASASAISPSRQCPGLHGATARAQSGGVAGSNPTRFPSPIWASPLEWEWPGGGRSWTHGESNPEPPACKAGALPVAP